MTYLGFQSSKSLPLSSLMTGEFFAGEEGSKDAMLTLWASNGLKIPPPTNFFPGKPIPISMLSCSIAPFLFDAANWHYLFLRWSTYSYISWITVDSYVGILSLHLRWFDSFRSQWRIDMIFKNIWKLWCVSHWMNVKKRSVRKLSTKIKIGSPTELVYFIHVFFHFQNCHEILFKFHLFSSAVCVICMNFFHCDF